VGQGDKAEMQMKGRQKKKGHSERPLFGGWQTGRIPAVKPKKDKGAGDNGCILLEGGRKLGHWTTNVRRRWNIDGKAVHKETGGPMER